MKRSDPHATEETQNLLSVLTHGPVGLPSPMEAELAQKKLLPWLEAEVQGLPQRRQKIVVRRRLMRCAQLGVLPLAAGFAAMFWLMKVQVVASPSAPVANKTAAPSHKPQVTEPYVTLETGQLLSGSVTVLSGSRLGMSGKLVTGQSQGATLHGSSGFDLVLAPGTEIALLGDAAEAATSGSTAKTKEQRLRAPSEKETRLYLAHGSADFAVPPLASGSGLRVTTADAQVKVIGTRFIVTTGSEGTCVRVIEGAVLVTRATSEQMLTTGGQSGCPDDPSSPPISKTAKPVRDLGSVKKTNLSAESALLSEALSHESRGRYQRAAQSYRKLLDTYPQSSFAPEARAGLARASAHLQ